MVWNTVMQCLPAVTARYLESLGKPIDICQQLSIFSAWLRAENPMREHIEFIQAQRLPWDDAGSVGFAGARIKLLSRDPDDGSFSAVLQLPARWSRPAAPLPFDEEIYVLDGDLEIGGVTYPDNAYGFLAAGTDANALRAPTEVVLLYFRSGHVAEHLKAPDAAAPPHGWKDRSRERELGR